MDSEKRTIPGQVFTGFRMFVLSHAAEENIKQIISLLELDIPDAQ